MTHIVVDGIAVCGAVGERLAPAGRPPEATCPACRAVLLYLGAPAAALLEDDALGVPRARTPEGLGD